MAPRNRSGRRSESIHLGASATYARDLAGALYVSAYPARQGLDATTLADGLGPGLTPEQTGKAITDLVTSTGYDQHAYLLTGAGLSPVNGPRCHMRVSAAAVDAHDRNHPRAEQP